ncbi:MAG: HNH endonuclease [Kiloniellales bacterium]
MVKSASGQSTAVSYRAVQKALARLQEIGAIRKEVEPDRSGTLYKVLIPEEIEAYREAMKTQQAEERKSVDISKQVDFYNVRENPHKIFERDCYKCVYCGKQLTRYTATLNHVTPVSAGGDNGYDNLVPACFACNSMKTGRPLGDFLAERENSPE